MFKNIDTAVKFPIQFKYKRQEDDRKQNKYGFDFKKSRNRISFEAAQD